MSTQGGRRRAAAMLTLLGVGLVLLLCYCAYVLYYLNAHQFDTEIAALRLLIKNNLPLGSSIGRTESFLKSSAIRKFETSHGFGHIIIDVSFEREPKYVSGSMSQLYPGGKDIVALIETNDGKYSMEINLFFDASDHLTHYSVTEWTIST